MILWTVLFYIGNLLDILSTYWGFRGLSKEQMQERELNPIISMFIHKKVATYAFKFGLSTIIVVLVWRTGALIPLQLISIMLFLIVANNVSAKLLTDKGKMSFGKVLTTKLRFPKAIAYLAILAILLFTSVGILYLAYM